MAKSKQTVSVSIDEAMLHELDQIKRRTRIARSVLICEGISLVIAQYAGQLSLPLDKETTLQTKETHPA